MMAAVSVDLQLAPWRAVNDGVMGGISTGAMSVHEHGLLFAGELSLENNGGFASVRRLLDEDLAATAGVRLKLRGDGRTYQFRVRLDDRWDGVAWRAEFATDGSWQILQIPFEAFEPVFRGRRVTGAGPVVAARIGQIGFMIADKSEGPFTLEIAEIEFVEAVSPASRPDTS